MKCPPHLLHRRNNVSILLAAAACLLTSLAPGSTRVTAMNAPVETVPTGTPFSFKIPAPRGQILDCQGRPLARMVTQWRLLIILPPTEKETWETYFLAYTDRRSEIEKAHPEVKFPETSELEEHFQHRRKLPVPTKSLFSDSYVQSHPEHLVPGVIWRAEYQRDYPGGTLAAHVIGYVTPGGPPLRGPLHHGESLWREVEGKEGLESVFQKQLAGTPGLLVITTDPSEPRPRQQVLMPPQPGQDVVTSLNREVQLTAETALASAKRPGSLVVVDPRTGNILAMASAPTFDPGSFASGMGHDEFEVISKDRNGPLNHRAVAGLYPPGSVFKPFVALGCLGSGRIQASTRFPCGPTLVIDGRNFDNWSEDDRGMFDMRAAMVRSCNTYFYQAALASGAPSVLTALREFGFGQRDPFPLPAFSAGSLPAKVPNRQALANLSIGQGDALASPLQVTMAMAALANGRGRPRPRLVLQIQDQQQQVLSASAPVMQESFNFPASHLDMVREGMYGVVNHKQGTGSKARLPKQRVFGKTGTAEWSNRGKRANVVWFAGYVPDSQPPLAYALALESKPGEKVSGGMTAAPVIHEFLSAVFADPARHGIHPGQPTAPLQDDMLNVPDDPAPPPAVLAQELAPGAVPQAVAVNANGAVPVAGLPPVVLTTNRAIPVEPPPPAAAVQEAPPPGMTNSSRSPARAPAPAAVLDPEIVTAPQPREAVQEPTDDPPPARRSPPIQLRSGNGVITTPAQPAVSNRSRRTPRPAAAPPAPFPQTEVVEAGTVISGPGPAEAEAPAGVALNPPSETAQVQPLPPPARGKRSSVRGNNAKLPASGVPKAVAVTESPPAAPRALPVDPGAAPDPALNPAVPLPPATPPAEPRKRRFKLFGNDDDDDDDKKEKDADEDRD